MLRGLLSPKRVVALVVTLAVIVGLVVSSLWLDKRVDRRRPMYRALVMMQGLQWDLLKEGKPGVYGVVRHKPEPTIINGHQFNPPRGVTVRVENRDGQTCIAVSNYHGDKSGWQCVNTSFSRPSLGGLQ